MKREVIEHTGHERDGWGKAATNRGYSHLVKLKCGHTQFVPNSRYRGIGSLVCCETCEEQERDKELGIIRSYGKK